MTADPKDDGPKDDRPGDDGLDRVIMSGGPVSLHDAFQRDVMRLLENTGISDEDRLRILSNTTCPCCGGSASLVVPLVKTPPATK